jgi:hypothetical protein
MLITIVSSTLVSNIGISYQMHISSREMSPHKWPTKTQLLRFKEFKSSFSSQWAHLNSLA